MNDKLRKPQKFQKLKDKKESDIEANRWKRHSSTTLVRDRWIHLTADRCETLTGVVLDPYYVMHESDWVHIAARDSQGHFLIVRQYRYAADTMCTEFPGGVIDAGESPLQAAQRELLEETGFTAQSWKLAGTMYANPARQTNRVHIFVAAQLSSHGAQQLDISEEITFGFMSPAELEAAIASGEFSQSLHIASYFLASKFT